MATPPVQVEFTVAGLETVKQAFREVAVESKQTSESIKQMDVSYRQLGVSIAHVGTAALAAESVFERLYSGQINIVEATIRLLPVFISLTSSLWTIVKALKGVAIAQSIVHALSGPAGWAILAGAAVAAVAAYALVTQIPSRQFGGPIYETGLYKLHAGEYVLSRNRSPVTINIYGMSPREAESISQVIVDRLRRIGAV